MKVMLLKAIVSLLALFPPRILSALSRPLGALAWRASNTRRATTARNLEACFPEMREIERDALARDSMRHFVMTGLEAGMGWAWSRRRLERVFIESDGFEYLEQALARGKGALALVPHFGNWELLSHWVQFRVPLLALYKPGGPATIETAIVRNRTRFGAVMAPTTGPGLKQLYRHTREGHLVAVLPDQDPGRGNGRFAPFFGVPALTGALSIRLIQKTGCEVVFAACRRVGAGRYQACFLPAEPGIHSGDMDTALAALNRGVERVVQLDPPQYLWAYKRFKSRPKGAPRFY